MKNYEGLLLAPHELHTVLACMTLTEQTMSDKIDGKRGRVISW